MERPLYERGDVVRWLQPEPPPMGSPEIERRSCDDGRTLKRESDPKSVKTGVVWVVDVGGAWGMHEHSYDILQPFEPCAYKHVPQREVIGLVGDETERQRVLAEYAKIERRENRRADRA